MRDAVRHPVVVVVFLACLCAGLALRAAPAPGPPRTYTLSFQHDGVNTESYQVIVDGQVSAVALTCVGEAAARTCTGPLTMTTNVTHTILVKAVGTFGDADSAPFGAAPPLSPAALVVR